MGIINKKCYKKIIQEDIDWLEENTNDCLDRRHIIFVLKDSVEYYYKKVLEEKCSENC